MDLVTAQGGTIKPSMFVVPLLPPVAGRSELNPCPPPGTAAVPGAPA
ncbi:hypothetical protein [Streptomyces sp. NPDC058374]